LSNPVHICDLPITDSRSQFHPGFYAMSVELTGQPTAQVLGGIGPRRVLDAGPCNAITHQVNFERINSPIGTDDLPIPEQPGDLTDEVRARARRCGQR